MGNQTKAQGTELNYKDGEVYNLSDGKTICRLMDEENHEAGKLFAASPKLLEALIKAKEIIERMSDEYSEVAGKHASYTNGESRVIESAIYEATN